MSSGWQHSACTGTLRGRGSLGPFLPAVWPAWRQGSLPSLGQPPPCNPSRSLVQLVLSIRLAHQGTSTGNLPRPPYVLRGLLYRPSSSLPPRPTAAKHFTPPSFLWLLPTDLGPPQTRWGREAKVEAIKWRSLSESRPDESPPSEGPSQGQRSAVLYQIRISPREVARTPPSERRPLRINVMPPSSNEEL